MRAKDCLSQSKSCLNLMILHLNCNSKVMIIDVHVADLCLFYIVFFPLRFQYTRKCTWCVVTFNYILSVKLLTFLTDVLNSCGIKTETDKNYVIKIGLSSCDENSLSYIWFSLLNIAENSSYFGCISNKLLMRY